MLYSDTKPQFMPGVSIDPPGARDLDDALWLHEDTLTVYIPDLSIIPHHSSREQRARERGFTRYFKQGNAPMLPRPLAEDHLSLLPNRPRRAIALHITLDEGANVRHMQAQRGVLYSQAQLTYADVPAILSNNNHPQASLRPMMARMCEIAQARLRIRRERGELAFYDLKRALSVGEEGQVRSLTVHEANIGFLLVQEMMLLANRTVAEWLLASNVPALFRNHRVTVAAPPRQALIADIEQMFAHPQVFDTETARHRLHLMLGRARYSPILEGHYGLNLPCYAHVTSPLRRYADMVNNRVINELITAREQNREPRALYRKEELSAVGDHIHALIMAQEQARREHFKARAEQEARERMETAPKTLATLPPTDFERVLKVSAQEAAPAEAVLQSARERMQRKKLQVRELFFLLYETPRDNDAWNALRLDALAHLNTQPHQSVSLLTMGVDLLDWPETRYQYSTEPSQQGAQPVRQTCKAQRQNEGGLLETDVYRAGNKKTAQQEAALALCHLLCGAVPPAPRPAPVPPAARSASPTDMSAEGKAQAAADTQSAVILPETTAPAAATATTAAPSATAAAMVLPAAPESSPFTLEPSATANLSEAAQPSTTGEAAEPAPTEAQGADAAVSAKTSPDPTFIRPVITFPPIISEWEWLRAPLQEGNWIHALNEVCFRAKQHRPPIKFTENKQKPPSSLPQWSCAATLNWNGTAYYARASAATKQAARTEVTRQLLAAICPIPFPELTQTENFTTETQRHRGFTEGEEEKEEIQSTDNTDDTD